MTSFVMEMDSLYQKALKLKGSGDLNEAANLFVSVREKITEFIHNAKRLDKNEVSQLGQIRAYACVNLIEHFERTNQPEDIADCLLDIEKSDPESPILKRFKK